MTARLIALLALVAGCQSKQEPPARTSEPAPVSTPSTPQTSVAPPDEPDRAGPPPLASTLPGTRTDVSAWVGSASRAAIGDVDKDGDREIVIADAKRLAVFAVTGKELASTPAVGGIQVLVAADLESDGRAEIIAGWGITRDHLDARATVTLYRLDKTKLAAETVLAPETERAEITAIVPQGQPAPGLLIGYYESKYMVRSVNARPGSGGWNATPIASIRMASSYARGDVDGDGAVDTVVGRMYGDDKGLDGDAFVLAKDGARTPLPTTRGLRSLAVADTDGDKQAEIFVGDGWHQAYAKSARGLLTWIRRMPDGFRAQLIEDTAGQYAIERILIAQIDGKPVLVTLGSHYVRVFKRDGDRWRGLTIGGPARDIAVGDLDGVTGDEILIVADKSEIVSLRGVAWAP